MFKIIACIILSLTFMFNLFLNMRSYRSRNNPIPEELDDVYDKETYLKWKKYSAEHIIVDIIFTSISYALMLALLLTDVLSIIVNNIDNIYLSALVVIAIYLGITEVIGFIEDYIRTMKIEEKYGFNKSSMKTLISDSIKGLIISAIFFIGLNMLFILLYESIHDYILIVFTVIVFALFIIFLFLYPLFTKIYNKFQSLEDGELRTNLINMLTKNGYQVRDIKVMDASRRTSKSNAYFTGFGKTKTIVLFDNLLKVMSDRQIMAIFAHEMGHGLHKDTTKNSFITFINFALIVTITWLLVKLSEIHYDFGFTTVNYGFAFILLLTVVMPLLSVAINLLTSFLSRKAEYKADEQAVKEGYGEDLITGLKVLFRKDFGDLNPDKLVVLLSYSHPTLLQRIHHIREYEKSNSGN